MKIIVYNVLYYKEGNDQVKHHTVVFINAVWENVAINTITTKFKKDNKIVYSVSLLASEIHEKVLDI